VKPSSERRGRNIKITVAYDGCDFYGWQVQKTGRTVQGVIEAALERMHDHPLRIQGAGRTDSGVHATGQVANFFSDLDSIPADRFREAMNSYLPPDIRIIHSCEAPPQFNAKNSARMRIYGYNLYDSEVGYPHLRRYCWKIRHRPDIENINRIASCLVGEKDFSTFAAAGDASNSKIRKVYSAHFFPSGPYLVFRVAASSFLWKMVRSFLGTILELDQNGMGAEAMREILESRERSRAGSTAPARGLFLERIIYDDDAIC
jgi:tRNA pseudouridine38-40 synthase